MKRLLYISPYFPPQTKVGALRPLKFVRHLPNEDWLPTVLSDLRPGEVGSASLNACVPEGVEVVADYGWISRTSGWTRLLRPQSPPTARSERVREENSSARLVSRDPKAASRPQSASRSCWNAEWFPWGEHFLDVRHAVRAGRGILRKQRFDAILVNADPYAALRVGHLLSHEFSIPWVADLRDPWSVCELRRPLRPAWVRRFVDAEERELIESASVYVLNTTRATEDYQTQFPDLADRFTTLRNHVDPGLFTRDAAVEWPEFTILFLGTFRRFVSIEPILRALLLLKSRLSDIPFKLRVVGKLNTEEQAHITRWGASDLVEVLAPRPYREAGSLMHAADLLLSQSHDTDQRIVAKLYDYFSSERPILHLGVPNRELKELFEQARGVDFCTMDDAERIARVLESHLREGRQRSVERDVTPWSSAQASRRLAAILDRALAGAPRT